MPDERTYWLEAKSYGIGWTLPVTWQGWVVVMMFFALLIGGLPRIDDQKVRIAYVISLVVALVIVVAWKGEKPFKWRWGEIFESAPSRAIRRIGTRDKHHATDTSKASRPLQSKGRASLCHAAERGRYAPRQTVAARFTRRFVCLA